MEALWPSKGQCYCKRLHTLLGQPKMENGKMPEENHVSNTSSSAWKSTHMAQKFQLDIHMDASLTFDSMTPHIIVLFP